MFKNLNKKRTLLIGGVLLMILNALAYYLINSAIESKLALTGVQDPQHVHSVEQNAFFSTIFSAVVITLDIVCLLFLLYLLHKFIFKTLKKATTIQP